MGLVAEPAKQGQVLMLPALLMLFFLLFALLRPLCLQQTHLDSPESSPYYKNKWIGNLNIPLPHNASSQVLGTWECGRISQGSHCSAYHKAKFNSIGRFSRGNRLILHLPPVQKSDGNHMQMSCSPVCLFINSTHLLTWEENISVELAVYCLDRQEYYRKKSITV